MVILKKINAKGKQRHIKALSDDEMKNLFGGYSFPVDSDSCSSVMVFRIVVVSVLLIPILMV